MKTISGRLNFLRGYLGLSQPEVAARFGIPYNTYIKYEHGSSKPGAEAIEGIARAGINVNWLLTGDGPIHLSELLADEGSILISDLPATISSSEDEDGEHAIYIDHYVDVRGSAGPGTEVFEEEVIVKARIDGRLLRERVGNGFASIKLITVSGDSMEPTLLHGDQVMVDVSCTDFVDDAIYAIQQGGHLRIKRVKLKLDGSIIVKSDNVTHNEPETYTAEEAQHFKVIGKIIPFKFGRFKV